MNKILAQFDVGGQAGVEGQKSVFFPLTSPIGATDPIVLLNQIIDILTLYIAAPVAVLMIVIGAFQILSAGGNVENVSKGKKTILYAAIGFAVLLIADLLIGIVAELLGVKSEFLPK